MNAPHFRTTNTMRIHQQPNQFARMNVSTPLARIFADAQAISIFVMTNERVNKISAVTWVMSLQIKQSAHTIALMTLMAITVNAQIIWN